MTDVPKAVAPLLAELGFRKRAGGTFTVDLADDVVGWLGLNRATRHQPAGHVEINPVVGVRHQAVERVVAELRGEKFHEYTPPTICTPIGNVMPERNYRSWHFAPDSVEATGRDMTRAIATYGVPFMRANATLPEIYQRMTERLGYDHQLVYTKPVALLLAGEPVRAREVMERAAAAVAGNTDGYSAELRAFAAAFDQMAASYP